MPVRDPCARTRRTPLRSRGRGPPPADPVGWVPGVTSRPVVMSVDDDPSVSRAVARDLRRHLGDDYRVVRAESGPDALEALRELTVRGEPRPCCWPTTGCPA